MAQHVVLVGLMGSGKSTVGKRLAARLERPFIDADHALEERAGATVAEVFERDGQDGFRAMESEVLAALAGREDASVIAAGGGIVLRPENRERLRQPDLTVVFLDAGPAFLASRVKPKAHRPLLHGDADPRQVFARLHAERAPLYAEVADLTVSVEPFHDQGDEPRQALADRVAELVRAREHELAS